MNRDFKGVWIDKVIWLNKELGWTEKLLLVEIDSFCENGECFASNEYFAGFFDLSKDRISKVISALIEKGYVESRLIYAEGTKQVIKRVLTTRGYRRKQLGGIGENADTPIGENAEDINISPINTSINTHTQEASVLESIKYPSKLPKLIYDKWQAIPDVVKDGEYLYWLQRDFRDISQAIQGFHSDIVLLALDNYRKERENPNSWMTAKVSSRKFFTGELFGHCRELGSKPKDVPRCKSCTCELLKTGPNAGTCQNDECDMYHKEQI